MAFKIVKDLTFTRDVPVLIPMGDSHHEQKLRLLLMLAGNVWFYLADTLRKVVK